MPIPSIHCYPLNSPAFKILRSFVKSTMPRAPKPCRKRTADADAEVSKEPQKAARRESQSPKMVETLVKSFKSWVATGQGTAALPLELIEKLSHQIWEVKMSSWKCETGKDVADLACVSALDDVVTAVFKAIEKKCLTAGDLEKNRCKASVVKLQNSSAGLVLAAMVLDLSAFQQPSREQAKATSPQIQPGEEVVASAMSFLWHQARFALPTLLESKASTEAASTCAGLARTIRSIHHILAARRYTSNALPAACLAHKAAPMAAQCVTLAASLTSTSAACVKTALATLGEASSDLLVGLSGYGCAESALQSFAMTEFGRLATLSSMFVNSLSANSKGSGRGAQHGPSFLALVLRAIGAPLLPLGLYSKDPKDLSQMAVERVAAADTRAGHLAAVVIQHSLLESERSEAMHALVQQLCAACGDPFWAAAPLYALRLVGALSRVAGASRMIDLDCSQREEATRLLAKAAEALTISAHEAKQIQLCRCCGAEAGPDCELCMLKAWAPERKREGKSIKMPKDPLALVISLVDAVAADDGLLAPASARWAAGELQGSALSANNARCNVLASERFRRSWHVVAFCVQRLFLCKLSEEILSGHC